MNTIKPRATILAATLVGAIALMGTPSRTHAFFFAIPCQIPHICITLCCPKPCPTLSLKRLAATILEELRNRMTERFFEQILRDFMNVANTLGWGCSRERIRYTAGGSDPLDAVPALPRAAFEAARIDENDVRHASEARRQSATTDTEEAIMRLSAMLLAASERAERAQQGVQNARDMRDIVRRMTEVALAHAEIDDIRRTAEALRLRLRASHTGRTLVSGQIALP